MQSTLKTASDITISESKLSAMGIAVQTKSLSQIHTPALQNPHPLLFAKGATASHDYWMCLIDRLRKHIL